MSIKINGNMIVNDNGTDLRTLKDMNTQITNRMVKSYSGKQWYNGSSVVKLNTGISVNGGDGGKTYLVCFSGHVSDKNNVTTAIFLLRCGYNGNNYTMNKILQEVPSGTYQNWSYDIDDNGIFRWWSIWGCAKCSIYQLT